MSHKVYLISDNGDGVPQRLEDWDGEDTLVLRLSAFANDAVIEVEPEPIKEQDNEQ